MKQNTAADAFYENMDNTGSDDGIFDELAWEAYDCGPRRARGRGNGLRGRGRGAWNRGVGMGPGRSFTGPFDENSMSYGGPPSFGPFPHVNGYQYPPWMPAVPHWQYAQMGHPGAWNTSPWALNTSFPCDSRGAGVTRRGMVHKPFQMRRLNHLMTFLADESEDSDSGDDTAKNNDAAAEVGDANTTSADPPQKPKGEPTGKLPGRRQHVLRRLQKLAENMDYKESEDTSSESETDKDDCKRQRRRRHMMKFLQKMKEENGKPCMRNKGLQGPPGRVMPPWAGMHMPGGDSPGLPPQLLRRIRQVVKSLEEQNRNADDINVYEKKSPEKQEQLRRLMQMLERASGAGRGMQGPAGRRMPPWAAWQATEGSPCVPPPLIARIRRLVRSMEEEDTQKHGNDMEADEPAEADMNHATAKEDVQGGATGNCSDDGKPCMGNNGRRGPPGMRGPPWAAGHVAGGDSPGLPPQLLRRIRQVVKSLEDQNRNADDINVHEGQQKAENKSPVEKQEQLRRLMQMLERASGAGRGMQGPAGRRLPPWATWQATEGSPCLPPPLIARIRRLVKSMEEEATQKHGNDMEADEPAAGADEKEATAKNGGDTDATNTSSDEDEQQRRQMRRLVRIITQSGGHGPRGCGGMAGMYRRHAWGPMHWANPINDAIMGGHPHMEPHMGCSPHMGPHMGGSPHMGPHMGGPPHMGIATHLGLPPRFLRRVIRCGNPAKHQMMKRQHKQEMKKAEEGKHHQQSEESPLEDWTDLKKDINQME